MADMYTQLVNSGLGRRLSGALGLPQPVPLRRWEAGQDLLPRPDVLLVGGRDQALPDRLLEWGLEVSRHAEPGRKYGAILADFSEASVPADLEKVALGVSAGLKQLARSGRVVVLGRRASGADVAATAAQAGVAGFMRSLAHEMRGGATCNALVLEPGTEPGDDAVVGPLRFLLSARSAYVSGQPLTVGRTAEDLPATDPDRPLEGRTAVATGAARGIGAAIVRRLHEDGARLVLVDVPAAGQALSQVANEVGGLALQLDVTAADAGSRIAEAARRRFGTLDVVVHNAGITRDKLLANMDQSRWASVLAVNLESQLRMNEQLLSSGVLGAHPHFVSLASTSGIAGNRGQTNYAASKAGIIGTVAAQAEDFARRGGTTNAVAPGFIETEMTKAMPAVTREVARRLNSLSQGGLPEDVAQAVSFLASDAAAAVNGQVLRVCGQSMVGA